MFLFGHLGSALLLNYIFEYFKYERNDLRKVLVAFGSILPDLIDKPIGGLIFSIGRWFGHSLLFLTSISVLILVFNNFKSQKDMVKGCTIIIYIGAIIHLLGDYPIGLNVILWPFFGPFDITGSLNFLLGVRSPKVIILELVGLLVIFLIGIDEDWSKNRWLYFSLLILLYITSLAFLFFIFLY